MHHSGIGGFQTFDAALLTPKLVEKRLVYMTPDWKDAFRLATRLADSLKLEMAIAGSPGWSESGGPWVQPKDGMKKLVWQQVRVKGGVPFKGSLPKPFTTTGAFQNMPVQESIGLSPKTAAPPEYYEDVAVVAYRLPATDRSLTDLKATVSSSGGDFTLAQLTDGDLSNARLLPRDSVNGYAWIQYAFQQPQTFKAITVVGGGIRDPFGIRATAESRGLEVSDDGIQFRRIASIAAGGVPQQTIAIPAIAAKYVRVTFQNPLPPSRGIMGGGRPPAGTDVAELVLHTTTRINHAEEKAGFAATYDLEKFTTPTTDDAVAFSDVVDLTGKLSADGTLTWTAPAGEWNILRFGYSLTGKQNHPASPEATGLEVDKLDARAVKDYFTTYLNQYKDATGGLMGSRGLQYMVTDSYESGQETWTPAMASEFQKRRGYNLLPWMPVLTGQVVKSVEASEQFLWDWRKTIAELITDNHYNQLTTLLDQYGMKRYTESHENGRVYIVDGMDVKRNAAVPMSAMWVQTAMAAGSTPTMAEADIRESASVAHIYGQNFVAAESMTTVGMSENAWSYHPANLKPTADLEMANGVNRFVIHTSVHQPLDKLPGLGLGPIGQWFNRLDTWSGQAKAWTDYLARNSFLLQQGKFMADVVYYYGEDNNITGLFGAKLPDVPSGYAYDFINPHALLNLLSVKNGQLVTPSGMTYRMLHLDDNARRMSLPVLRKIAQLVRNGAVISGIKPELTASLTDNPQEFKRLVNEVWGVRRANVHTGKTVEQVLTTLAIQPDFSYNSSVADLDVRYVHRRTAEADLYWVNSRSEKAQTVDARFRVIGKIPQLWHPETGQTEPVSYTISGGRTTVSLPLSPQDAVFVVFEAPATQTMATLPGKTPNELATVAGPWQVTFQSNRGAPATATFDRLASYTENPDAGIKYFSGTATYTQTVNVPGNALGKGEKIWLDLGEVGNLAEVLVNGQSTGVVWKAPFRVDITKAVKPGANTLAINVTNVWVNRLIGDKQPGVSTTYTTTTFPYYKATSTLQPAGLLGPVRLLAGQ